MNGLTMFEFSHLVKDLSNLDTSKPSRFLVFRFLKRYIKRFSRCMIYT